MSYLHPNGCARLDCLSQLRAPLLSTIGKYFLSARTRIGAPQIDPGNSIVHAQYKSRHGPKPARHEAEAFSMLEAEAQALTHFSLEVEALVTKPKPGYLYSTNVCWIGIQHLKSESGFILYSSESESESSPKSSESGFESEADLSWSNPGPFRQAACRPNWLFTEPHNQHWI